jgi:hypothetical protein
VFELATISPTALEQLAAVFVDPLFMCGLQVGAFERDCLPITGSTTIRAKTRAHRPPITSATRP